MIDGDRRRLSDMLRLAREAVELVGDRDGPALEASYVHFLAVVGALILLGEASAQLSDGLKRGLPEMPWRQAKDLRNLLVHRYFEIDAEQLANTVRRRLPMLIVDLQTILQAEDEPE